MNYMDRVTVEDMYIYEARDFKAVIENGHLVELIKEVDFDEAEWANWTISIICKYC